MLYICVYIYGCRARELKFPVSFGSHAVQVVVAYLSGESGRLTVSRVFLCFVVGGGGGGRRD